MKNGLSEYLRLVKRGEIVEVLEDSVPIARLQGIDPESVEDGLERLVRKGIVTRAKRKPGTAWLKLPAVPCMGDAVQALIRQRGTR